MAQASVINHPERYRLLFVLCKMCMYYTHTHTQKCDPQTSGNGISGQMVLMTVARTHLCRITLI